MPTANMKSIIYTLFFFVGLINMVCSPNFFVVKIDEFHGNLADSLRYVANTRTLDRRFLVDNSKALAGISEMIKKFL